MDEFNADPLRVLRYLINKETHPDGYKIAKLVHDQYFTDKIPYEDQLTQLEKVLLSILLYNILNEKLNFSTRSPPTTDFSNVLMNPSNYLASIVTKKPTITIIHIEDSFRILRWLEYPMKLIWVNLKFKTIFLTSCTI